MAIKPRRIHIYACMNNHLFENEDTVNTSRAVEENEYKGNRVHTFFEMCYKMYLKLCVCQICFAPALPSDWVALEKILLTYRS